MDRTPEQIVRDFCAAWGGRDVDDLLDFFAPDAVYHNMPIDPARGHDEIRPILEMFVPVAEKIEFEMLNVVASGDLVFTERVDRFWMGERTVELPVAGVFEIRDGKIAAWRDYFDLQTYMNQSSG